MTSVGFSLGIVCGSVGWRVSSTCVPSVLENRSTALRKRVASSGTSPAP